VDVGASRSALLFITQTIKVAKMNERIKELALQARNYALDEKRIYERMHNTEQCMEEYREVYNKKFAELIVKECMDIAKQVENEKFEVAGSAEPEYRKGINDGRRNAAWGIKNRMKLHFGVEE
jgi:hypothetical protein